MRALERSIGIRALMRLQLCLGIKDHQAMGARQGLGGSVRLRLSDCVRCMIFDQSYDRLLVLLLSRFKVGCGWANTRTHSNEKIVAVMVTVMSRRRN
jgi:hypothetical protein